RRAGGSGSKRTGIGRTRRTRLEQRGLVQRIDCRLEAIQRSRQGTQRRYAGDGGLLETIQLGGLRRSLRIDQYLDDTVDVDSRTDTCDTYHDAPRQKFDGSRLVA